MRLTAHCIRGPADYAEHWYQSGRKAITPGHMLRSPSQHRMRVCVETGLNNLRGLIARGVAVHYQPHNKPFALNAVSRTRRAETRVAVDRRGLKRGAIGVVIEILRCARMTRKTKTAPLTLLVGAKQ